MNRSRQNSDSKYSTNDGKIIEGEKVLCYHGNLMYEAKCLKIRESEKEPDKVEYFIHYAGWSRKWEEWAEESRVLKYTEENVKKQMSLKENGKQLVKKTPGRKSSTAEKDKDSGSSRPCSPAVSVKSNKSNQDTSGKDKDDFEPEPKKKLSIGKEKNKGKEKENDKIKDGEIKEEVKSEDEDKRDEPEIAEMKYKVKVNIPDDLTQCLINDFNMIQKKQFLTTVPADITIQQLFDDFLGLENLLEAQHCGLTDFLRGLKEYVNEMMGFKLLYRFEKPQFKFIKDQYPNKPLHELYGPVHVLRVITLLEMSFNTLLLSPQKFKTIENYTNKFLKFLNDNRDKYFNEDVYHSASSEYLKLALK